MSFLPQEVKIETGQEPVCSGFVQEHLACRCAQDTQAWGGDRGAGAVTKLGCGHYLAPQVGQHCKKPR